MHAHTSLTLSFSDDLELDLAGQVREVVENAANDVNVYFESDGSLNFEESYALVWYEDIVDVAKVLAGLCKGKTGFVIDGTVDTSESAGEYMDFYISFKDDVLSCESSPWYLCYNGTDCWDDDYDTFCEEFDRPEDVENGVHTYSEEFFNALKTNDEWYTTNGFGCDLEIWLDGVHMDEPIQVEY